MRQGRIKVRGGALVAFETRVYELAADPDAFGLDDDERYAYQLAWDCFDDESSYFTVPADAADQSVLRRLFVDIESIEDDVAEDKSVPSDIRRSARSVRDSLGCISWKLAMWGA